MGKLKNKKQVNLTIDSEIIDVARCYINNLSAFVETCLKNYINKNSDIIQNDEFLTAKMRLKELESSDLPNITYIIDNNGCILDGFEVIDDHVYSKKRKSLNIIDKRFSFITSCVASYNGKKYFVDLTTKTAPYNYNSLPDVKSQVIDDDNKWW